MNLNKKLVDKETLLKYVNDVEIYHHYGEGVEVILNKAQSSPLRSDPNPSFGFFEGESGEICFNDFVLGKGDCIKFVQLMFGLNFFEALSKIVIDFNLNEHFIYKAVNSTKKYKYNENVIDRDEILSTSQKIQLAKRSRKWKIHDILYWSKYGISIHTLNKYNVEPIDYIFINGKPICAEKHAYCFTEYKDGKETYKIYQPYSKEYKWINNHDSSVWQGWEQLPETGDTLIITKSLKDVMCIVENLDVPSVSLQAEGIKPKKQVIDELKSRFKTVYILYDNDFDKEQNWGQLFANDLAKEHKLINNVIPTRFATKDISDLYMKLRDAEYTTFPDGEKLKKDKEKLKTFWHCNIQMPF